MVVVIVTLLAVLSCVLVHYEGLSLLSKHLARHVDSQPRREVLYGIFGVMGLHVVEIWIFGIAAWSALRYPGTGAVTGADVLSLFDAVYMAAITYTTVGFGDLTPIGPLRFLSGTAALTGFVLITWSASFTFLEMERFWKRS